MNWISFAVGAIVASVFAFLLHTVLMDRLEHKQQVAIITQQAADKKLCDSQKSITKEANDALQKDRDHISDRLNTLLMQHPSACVMPVSSKPKLSGSKSAKHAGSNGASPHGISTDWLRGYAAECEGYRTEVMVCKKYFNEVESLK